MAVILRKRYRIHGDIQKRKLRIEHLEPRALLTALAGDYNVDGAVDAADYTVWRDNLGTENPLPNDAHGGVIGPAQYAAWKENFGRVAEDGLRLMENLGRGVVATRSSSSQVFVSWRSLALDPADLAFNVYRSAGGGVPVRLNLDPLVGGTNFTDNTANLALANNYFVRPVVDGVEQEPSDSFTLPANSEVEPLFGISLRNITGNYDDYRVQFAWVGDLDGDGEYDFVVSRVPVTTGLPDVVEAYLRDGTLLWSVDMGHNSLDRQNIEVGSSAVSVGHWDGVTVYDLDSDGRAEVAIRTANGVTFGDGSTLSYPADDNVQFISVLDGLTGAERARIQVPTDYLADGPMAAHMGVGYLDGVLPSLVVKMKNRVGNGPFNLMTLAYDFDGELIQKWKFNRGNQNLPDAHQFRIIDVDQDGIDEVVEIGFVLNGDGTLKYSMAPHGIVHGDRFHIGDLDPDRPGLEGYGVQQNNPSGLLEYYYDAATGEILHSRFSAAMPGGDVGRGIVADVDPNHRGYEYWSFFGIHNSSTPVPGEPPVETQLTADPNRPWPNFRIWWDGDVLSENLDGWKIEKWNPAAQNLIRLGTLWHFGASPGPRGAPAFYGDILGDWREEIIYESADGTELQIYTSQIPTATRIYALAQNPAYRNALTVKGYMQSHMLDYYLGHGMSIPPTPNIAFVPPSSDGNAAPTVAAPAAASSSTVTGIATNLSVLGADDAGEANLTYTWWATGGAGTVSFSSNVTNDAKNTTATFSAAGTYSVIVTIRDADGKTTTSDVTVTVNQALSSVHVTPPGTVIFPGTTQQFAATAYDQFGRAMTSQPAFTWSVATGGGSVNSAGLYTAPGAVGSSGAGSAGLLDAAFASFENDVPPAGSRFGCYPSVGEQSPLICEIAEIQRSLITETVRWKFLPRWIDMNIRSKWFLSTLLCLFVSSQAPAQTIGIFNGDFEEDTPVASPPSGWSASIGTMYVTAGGAVGDPMSPYSGSNFVTANRLAPNPEDSFPNNQSMGIFQTVDVSTYASEIDLGNRYAELTFAYADGDSDDGGTVSMRFLDASASPLGSDVSFYTSNQSTAGTEWDTASLVGTIPVGTRSIEFSLLAERTGDGGTVRNVTFDALTAQLLDTLPPAPPRDVVHGNLIQFVDNGAWSWFQDERAIVDQQKGKIIVGSMANRDGIGGEARDGHVQTTHFDLATGSRTLHVHNDLESYGAGDDHNVPGLLKKSDGNLLAFYAAHNRLVSTEDDRSYYRTFDVDTEAWSAESEYHWWDVIPDNAPGAGGTTYSNVFQLSSEDTDGDGNGRLYNIARTQQSPHIMYSDDNGATWQYGGQLTKQNSTPPTGGNYVNGYYKYSSNGVDRIDMIATEYHPGDYNTSIYHAYIQNGKLYDSSGNEIDGDIFDAAQSFDASNVTSTDDFTNVFQSGATQNSRAWTTDVQRYDDGTIIALYKARAGAFGSNNSNTSLDHRVWYSRFDPNTGQWTSTEIAKAGARLFGGEYDYTGLGAIHPHDPNTLYISTEVDPTTGISLPHHEIYKGTTTDNGANWTWTAITENSSFDNLRPIVPAWDENNTTVLWWRGTMDTSHDYDTAVIGIIDRKEEKLGKLAYFDATTDNTSLADGSPLVPTGPTPNPGAADGNWHQLTAAGNNGSVFSADETGSENAPTLKTTVDGLEPGTYDVFAFFWSDIHQDWRIEAGLSEESMNLFRIRGSQQAEAEHFDLAPILDEGNRALYRGYVGRVEIQSGASIDVYINDSTGSEAERAWYDGIGIARVLPIQLVGDYNNDGTVDAADYTVWRDNLGTEAELPNDPVGGTIGSEQYNNWKANFGTKSHDNTEPPSSAQTLPEPQSLLLLVPGILASVSTRTFARQ